MKFYKIYNKNKKLPFKKLISTTLTIGLFLNNSITSFSGTLSDDGRYESFEGKNIIIDNILEEDKVDVEIEGNTMVNVANQKDPVPITKSYTIEGTNHIPFQGEYDGKARPVIEGNTMYYNNDTGKLTETFTEGANLSLVSSFEDQLVTKEMVDSGLEKAENLGKYKVEYKVTGKNKFDINSDFVDKYLNINMGTLEENASWYTYNSYIPINPNTDYTISNTSETNLFQFNVCFYDNNKNFISGIICKDYTKKYTIVTPSNAYFCRITYSHKVNGVDANRANIQLEEGSIATEYEPYKESIKTFYLNSPLLEGDTIEDIDGKATYVKRCKEIILNGSEKLGENSYTITRENTVTRYISVPNGKLSSPINNSFNRDKKSVNQDIEGVVHDGYGLLYIAIDKSRLQTFDTNGFKQWLSENPMTVVYELAEPIYEIISGESILIDSYVDGHLDLNTSIPVNKVDFIPTTANLNYLYPSTEYTVQFESNNKGKIDTVSLDNELLYSNYTVNKGINRFNITTPSEISSTELILDGIGFNLSNLVATEATDESFNYFEGMKSAGQDDENGHNIEIISTNSDGTQSNKIEIRLSEPLRSLPNGIKDRIIKRNGQWVVERNCREVMLDGSEDWMEHLNIPTNDNYSYFALKDSSILYIDESDVIISKSDKLPTYTRADLTLNSCEGLAIQSSWISIGISNSKIIKGNLSSFINYLSDNPIKVIYQLAEPIYEPLNIDSTINTYLDITHISNNSNIPTNMKVTVDRVINRAVEAIELVETNPIVENLSLARMWTNLLKETINKDILQNQINNITKIEDLQIEKKAVTANMDIYIKPENSLSMSLSTNKIIFEDYSSVSDLDMDNAVRITVNSSLPYNLNSYLETEIQNSDGSNIINKDFLHIKDDTESEYKQFLGINQKLILKEDCIPGSNNIHNIDLRLKASTHDADVYRTTIKFEAEQK